MILDEAIKHAEEVAEEKENEGKLLCQSEGASIGCLTCAEEHRQLAEWLKELKQLREQTRWIPVSEGLPKKPYGCIVTVMDTNPMTCDEFENIYPNFVGWDGENWNDADGYSIPFEVIAWMPSPQPYKAESEDKE